MLAIEIDGSSHDGEDAMIRDIKRQSRLESFGVRFLRFADIEVKQNITGVVRKIKEWVELHKDELVGRYPDSTEPEVNYLEESPKELGLPDIESQPIGDKKAGVVWHTQGSGKSKVTGIVGRF